MSVRNIRAKIKADKTAELEKRQKKCSRQSKPRSRRAFITLLQAP